MSKIVARAVDFIDLFGAEKRPLMLSNIFRLLRILTSHLPSDTTAEWLASLHAADISMSPVNSIEQPFNGPQIKAVGLFDEIEHPTEGRLKAAHFRVKFSKSSASVRHLASNLGEYIAEVRAESTPQPCIDDETADKIEGVRS